MLASKNRKKLEELKQILAGLEVELLSLHDFPQAPEVSENGSTFGENAVKKACAYARWSGYLTMADDSGLCVEALDGKPGVYSARFAGEEKSDFKNCQKLLHLLKDVAGGKRGAYFKCAVAIAEPEKLIGVVEGQCSGQIGMEMKGNYGFGYDPVFIYPEYGKTFAELGGEIKNKVSHRARALEAARELLVEYLNKKAPKI